MNRFVIFLFLGFISLSLVGVFAEDISSTGKVGAPKEPEIVLPPVILQVENLTVERVKATLPEDSEIIPPERDVPLPDLANLTIEEPILKSIEPLPVVERLEKSRVKLNAEGRLGIGNMNHIVSAVSLYKLGDMPRYKLAFSHEMMDGFAFHPAGSGFSSRKDSIEGFFRFSNSGYLFHGDASFDDREIGLQGKSSFLSEIDRLLKVRLGVNKSFGDYLTLSPEVCSSGVSLLLTGSLPESISEYSIEPKIDLDFSTDKLGLGLTTAYQFRNGFSGYDFLLNRLRIKGKISGELPLNLEGVIWGGWFFSTGGLNLFTYGAEIKGSPLSLMSIYLSGGFDVREYNLFDLVDNFVLTSIPDEILDNPLYYGKADVKVSLLESFVVSTSVSVDVNNSLADIRLTGGFGDNSLSSLLYSRSVVSVRGDIGFKWDINPYFTVNGNYSREFWDRAIYMPVDDVTLGIIGIGPDGRYGGNLDLNYTTGFGDALQLPRINLGVFYKTANYIRIVGSIDDLLSVGGIERYDAFGLEEPGFKAVLEVQVSF